LIVTAASIKVGSEQPFAALSAKVGAGLKAQPFPDANQSRRVTTVALRGARARRAAEVKVSPAASDD
jgi:hypothetical protein